MSPARVPSIEALGMLRRMALGPHGSCGISRCNHIRIQFNSIRALSTTSTAFEEKRLPSKRSNFPPTSSPSSSAPSQTGKTNRYAPASHDRGPASKEDTQTDFGMMDIYANMPNPATSIDACTSDGFHLDNGAKITGYSGLVVAGGEAWSWKPWLALAQSSTSDPKLSDLLDARRGVLTIPKQSLGLFALLYPKPDLLILGTGSKLWMLSPETKKYLMEELGLRVDVMDTGNASAAYNLLAKERGIEGGASVGGAFLPISWKGPESGRRR